MNMNMNMKKNNLMWVLLLAFFTLGINSCVDEKPLRFSDGVFITEQGSTIVNHDGDAVKVIEVPKDGIDGDPSGTTMTWKYPIEALKFYVIKLPVTSLPGNREITLWLKSKSGIVTYKKVVFTLLDDADVQAEIRAGKRTGPYTILFSYASGRLNDLTAEFTMELGKHRASFLFRGDIISTTYGRSKE